MDEALWKAAQEQEGERAPPRRWSRKMSDHIAYALLVYTGLNIVLTVGAIKGALHGSILPYFSLVVLVGAIIPGCRWFEKRWERADSLHADADRLAPAFRRDRAMVWLAAMGLPVILTGVFKAFTTLV